MEVRTPIFIRAPVFSLAMASCMLTGEVKAADGTPIDSTLRATIDVDIDMEFGEVNKLLFGNNQVGYKSGSWNARNIADYSDRGAGVWNPATAAPVPEMVSLAKEAGMTVCRYPGGCGSHNFDWRKCVGPLNTRPEQKFGLPEFLKFCEEVGALPIITVAEYHGTARDAADLVEYCNAPDDGAHPYAAMRAKDGHPSPYGVVWFEYGNESYHGNHGGKEYPGAYKIFTPEEYGRRYLEYRQAMRKVDDAIRLGVVLETPGSEWDSTVLRTTGGSTDFVIPHIYIPRYNFNDGKPDAGKLFSIALAGPNSIAMLLARWRRAIATHTGNKRLPFVVTEYNGMFVQDKPVPYRLCLGNALVVAEHLRVYMREPSILMAVYWQFANEYWGMVKGVKEPYTRRPTYWVFWLYHNYFGETLVETTVDCPTYNSHGGFGTEAAYGKPARRKVFPDNILPLQPWNTRSAKGVAFNEQLLTQREVDGILVATIKTKENQNYYHASKRMTAEPLTGYLVSAEVLVECVGDASDTSGLAGWRCGIQVGDGRGWDATRSAALSNKARIGEWTQVSAEYVTLSDTKDIVIQARCLETLGVSGKISVRNVQARRFIPENVGAVPYLGVNASKSADGKTIFLMIVNKHLTNSVSTSISGFRAEDVKAYCLNGPSIDAVNDTNPDNVKVSETAAVNHGKSVEVVLPRHSMTAVVIRL